MKLNATALARPLRRYRRHPARGLAKDAPVATGVTAALTDGRCQRS